MDEIGLRYLSLALQLDRHFAGFVDAYYGPPQIKAQVMIGEPASLSQLAGDLRELTDAIEARGYNPQRQDYLLRQVRAMSTLVRNLSGERLDYVDEVELFFDVRPTSVDEGVYEAAHVQLARLLPGDGPLGERFETWRKGFEIAPERILTACETACQEAQRRTLQLFELPAGEDVELQLVDRQPWSAYNWYLGDYRSRIDINTDLPMQARTLVHLLTHEAYPGHHTEHAIKEYRLYRESSRAEHAVQLLLGPEAVISEGVANSAAKIIFDDAALADFLRTELYPAAGIRGIDIERQMLIEEAIEALGSVVANAALRLHRDGRPADEVQSYIEHYALRTPAQASQSMSFLQHPLFRSYIFTYQVGEALMAPLLTGPQKAANFRRLLTEPFTPSQLRAWLDSR
jgi:hypothetical protein